MGRESNYFWGVHGSIGKILFSTGGMKQELFQVDDVYERYYFVPENRKDAELQMELFIEQKKNALFLLF